MTTLSDKPISDEARAVLRALLSGRADCADRAMTDAEIARASGVHQRRVIDMRLALIEAGYLVNSTCGSPPGSFLDSLTGNLAASRLYLGSLRRRARDVLHRYSAFKRALEQAELARRPAATNGQINMPFADAADDAQKRMEAFTR